MLCEVVIAVHELRSWENRWPPRHHTMGQAATFEAVMTAPGLCILLLLPCEDFGGSQDRSWESTGLLLEKMNRHSTLFANVIGVEFSQADNHVLFPIINISLFALFVTFLLAAGVTTSRDSACSFHGSWEEVAKPLGMWLTVAFVMVGKSNIYLKN